MNAGPNSAFSQTHSVSGVLELARCGWYNDVTLLCRSGHVQANSFFLASVFPAIKGIFNRTLANLDEPLAISLPDLDKTDLEMFLFSVFERRSTLEVCQSMSYLLSESSNKNIKEEVINEQVESNDENDFNFEPLGWMGMMDWDNEVKQLQNNTVKCKEEMESKDVKFMNSLTPAVELKTKTPKVENGEKRKKRQYIKKKPKVTLVQSGPFMGVDKTNLRCSYCDHVAARYDALHHHINVKHLNIKESFSCETCGNVFTSRAAVVLHKRTIHEGLKFYCDVEGCDYIASSKARVNLHKQREHEGIRYLCEKCCKTFTNKLTLKKHNDTIHSDIVLHCDKCDFKTNSKMRLRKHTQGEHEGKKLCCDKCDFRTTWRANLKSHIQSKHPTEIFQCDQCSFTTTHPRKFNAHRKEHGE